MTRIEKLEESLRALTILRGIYLKKGDFIAAVKKTEEIDKVQEQLEAIVANKRFPLRELLKSNPEVLDYTGHLCIKLHVAADYIARQAYELNDYLSKHGLDMKSLTPECLKLAKDAERIAGDMVRKGEKYENLLVNDDTLLNAIDKKIESYVNQRMNRKDNKTT